MSFVFANFWWSLLLTFANQYAHLQIGEVSIDAAGDETTKKDDKQLIAKAAAKPSAFSIPLSDLAFGEQIPFGDPCWYQDWNSPYYNDSHRKFRAAMREFVEREIMPFCHEWDEKKKLPQELYGKCYRAGWLPLICGGGWPTEYVDPDVQICGGIKPEVSLKS